MLGVQPEGIHPEKPLGGVKEVADLEAADTVEMMDTAQGFAIPYGPHLVRRHGEVLEEPQRRGRDLGEVRAEGGERRFAPDPGPGERERFAPPTHPVQRGAHGGFVGMVGLIGAIGVVRVVDVVEGIGRLGVFGHGFLRLG